MLVTEESAVQHILDSISYLDHAEQESKGFLEKISLEMPKRINKADCLAIFKKYGFFRSYTLRATIAGKMMVPKRQSQKEMLTIVPTPSPPKRDAGLDQRKVADTDDLIEFQVNEFDNEGPASPQTVSEQSQSRKKGTGKGKKKKLKLKPVAAEPY